MSDTEVMLRLTREWFDEAAENIVIDDVEIDLSAETIYDLWESTAADNFLAYPREITEDEIAEMDDDDDADLKIWLPIIATRARRDAVNWDYISEQMIIYARGPQS